MQNMFLPFDRINCLFKKASKTTMEHQSLSMLRVDQINVACKELDTVHDALRVCFAKPPCIYKHMGTGVEFFKGSIVDSRHAANVSMAIAKTSSIETLEKAFKGVWNALETLKRILCRFPSKIVITRKSLTELQP
ncbi:uncharacterized protein NEMAJ01_0533 [Nematocida major]|uniref:uncharacterized protein n=1 Tax=Nematocida major TaxID=1912982 RepID=UPI002007FFE5|nr:uncharacterized protein NEMAJ01_0533 [Nematocida major]KAH9385637.1 hypothetical protein NEMAJ01_0533 [Nematocida major]